MLLISGVIFDVAPNAIYISRDSCGDSMIDKIGYTAVGDCFAPKYERINRNWIGLGLDIHTSVSGR